MEEKFTRKEFETLLGDEHPKVVDKAYLLANGMISVYGYSREKALRESLIIALEWFDNGEEFLRGKPL